VVTDLTAFMGNWAAGKEVNSTFYKKSRDFNRVRGERTKESLVLNLDPMLYTGRRSELSSFET